MGCVA